MLAGVKIKNFRNHKDLEVYFGPGLNLIVGENGVGKTNLLEAVFYLVEGRSIKGADMQEMIRSGEEIGWVEGCLTGEVEERGKVVLRRGENTLKKRLKTAGAVAFVPDDIFLVKGNPEWRRRFVDETIKAVKASYGELIKGYNRTLKQRNHALRMVRKETWRADDIRNWNLLLVRQGMEIVRERRAVLYLMSSMLEEETKDWGMGEVEVKYYSSFSVESEEDNLEKLERMEEAEIRKGMTLSGPHRDEVVFYLGGRNLRREGSQGEQKMFCLACRMVQARIIEERTPKKVLLLFDDCFSELDSGNRERLAVNLKRREQVLVTSTEEIRETTAERIINLDALKCGT